MLSIILGEVDRRSSLTTLRHHRDERWLHDSNSPLNTNSDHPLHFGTPCHRSPTLSPPSRASNSSVLRRISFSHECHRSSRFVTINTPQDQSSSQSALRGAQWISDTLQMQAIRWLRTGAISKLRKHQLFPTRQKANRVPQAAEVEPDGSSSRRWLMRRAFTNDFS